MSDEYTKAVVKFDNGNGACVCNKCRVILSYGFDHNDVERYCETCYNGKRTMSDTYTVQIELDSKTGEMILPVPQELIDQMGWNVGDLLIWEETLIWEEDGEFPGFTLRRDR